MTAPKPDDGHQARVAGKLPSGHEYCDCGRKVHHLAGGRVAHTSGKKIVGPVA